MTQRPGREQLKQALSAAAQAHHDYEANYLDGVADAHWAGWYAAFTLGRLGDFTTPTTLARLLAESPAEPDWPAAAARHVTRALRDA